MITTEDFENFLLQSETSILDFKKKMYDFENQKLKANSDLIKDVISFSNTIRNETSYIVFGIKELEQDKLDLIGIETSIDEAALQQKVSSNVFPKPFFNFYHINHQEKIFGILEFPVRKFDLPLTPTKDLKGLKAGSVYYRNGTSNTEATGLDVIRINDWLRSLPEEHITTSFTDEISGLIKRLTEKQEKLSTVITDILYTSKKYKLDKLREFCIAEIQGIKTNPNDDFDYRVHKVMISYMNANFAPKFYQVTQSMVRKEMEEHESFFNTPILIPFTILQIEEHIERITADGGTNIATGTTDTQRLLGMDEKHELYIYYFEDDFRTMYRNIRQKAIDLLMTV
ncbi:helix-turn-helix domain-containing protein [Christiangramia sp. LLG6405-1]|uniref:AlbA family DNA-binding domain-containing protein n=1 Tax=Christiangramia sp. LLG6405-1 TaxID=3160832 RepID=UPI00386537B9